MGKNHICDFNLFNVWIGNERGWPLGNVRVDFPDLPLQYGPGMTSHSKVIEFTVNDFFGEKWGNLPPLSQLLVCNWPNDQRRIFAPLHTWRVRIDTWIPGNWRCSSTKIHWIMKKRKHTFDKKHSYHMDDLRLELYVCLDKASFDLF